MLVQLQPQKRNGLRSLKATLKGCALESAQLSAKIRKAKKEQKPLLQYLKTNLSQQTRHHTIAYGLLRGLAYKEIERKCQFPEPLSLGTIHGDFLDVVLIHNIVKTYSPYMASKLPPETIREWMVNGTKLFLTRKEMFDKEQLARRAFKR